MNKRDYISEIFTIFIKKHKLPKIVLYELRHTFVSLSNFAGIQGFNLDKAQLSILSGRNL